MKIIHSGLKELEILVQNFCVYFVQIFGANMHYKEKCTSKDFQKSWAISWTWNESISGKYKLT